MNHEPYNIMYHDESYSYPPGDKMVMPSSSYHTVDLPDGTSTIYQLRSLICAPSVEVEEKQRHPNDTATTTTDAVDADADTDIADSDSDILNWTKFCASVFSYKLDPPSPSYFARHFYNDPRGDASLIRVLVATTATTTAAAADAAANDNDGEKGGEIASSIRIFRRTLSIPHHHSSSGTGSSCTMHYMEAGGIGEVCTSINHRRRGLSSILLKDAIAIMNSQPLEGERMACSLLHASPDFRPVYSKVGGYRSVTSYWSVVPVRWKSLLLTESETVARLDDTNAAISESEKIGGGTTSSYIVRNAKFPNDAPQLQQLHHEYSEKRLITIVRSEEYWTRYVSAELGDTLWVLCAKQPSTSISTTAAAGGTPNNGEDTIVAWLSLRKRGDRYQLREFGVNRRNTSTMLAMKYLLPVALNQLGVNSSMDDNKGEDVVSLLLPSIVVSDVQHEMTTSSTGVDNRNEVAFVDFDSAVEENDDGWMYIHMDNSQSSVVELTTREADPIQHLIWPTDSF